MSVKTYDVIAARARVDREKMLREMADLREMVNALKSENADLRQMVDLAERLEESSVQPMEIRPLRKNAKAEGAVLANLSDTHAFETVRPEQVSGLNRHTPAIGRARQEEFFRGVLKWTKIHRSELELPTLVLAWLGDLITNQLHDDQVECNAGTPQEEILFEMEVLQGGLDFLLKEGGFEKIVVVAVDGNHGRDTEKMRHANRVQHSHEWLMYHVLRKLYAHEKRLEWRIAEGLHTYVEVFGKTVRYHHGDKIKYKGGVGGITIPVNKAIEQWNKGRAAYLDIFGHWHQALLGQNFISNGSTIGYSTFSLDNKLPFELPMQTLAVIDKKRWLTSFHKIFV